MKDATLSSHAQQWLANLFEHTEGLVELRACPNVRGQGRVSSIFTRDPDEVAEFVAHWSGKPYGVYFGAGTRKRERGTAEDVAELPALWADLDNVDKAHALEVLKACYCPPTFIVDSGRGLHAWWLLDEPAEPSHEFTNLLRQLRRIFAGDPAVCDLARIMRLPGTHNSKYGDPLPVAVIHSSDRRYSFTDLQDWCSWQGELLGEPVNPFVAAAEKLGIRSTVDLSDMRPGNIHEIQLRVSASMAASGRPEDEIVAVLLEATKLAAGQEGARWNWRKEEAGLREMIRGAQKKFAVVDLAKVREQRKPDPEPSEKEPLVVRVAKVAMTAWGKPLITVKGELWTYEGGIWHQFEAELEHRLRVFIQGSVETLGVSPSNSTLNGAYRWILERPELVRSGIEWDRQAVIVGENGALEIITGNITAHSPDHHATRRVACRVDPVAECPTWLRFLTEALPEGAAGTLQEWFGAALVRGKVREMSKGLIVYGPSRTGKTQITEVVRALLGGNTCGLRVRAMSERFGMQPLVTASGWIADDAVGMREEMDAEAYKLIVTGESVSVERKNKTNVEVCFDIPVLLTMNNYPIVKDDSDAVYNRSLVLPMTRQWSEEEAQPVARQVVAEELSGVLNWALAGWHRLRQRGRFEPPEAMIAAGRDFKGQNNPMEEFIGLCIEESPMTYVMRNDFLRIFNNWMKVEIQARNGWSGKAVGLALSKNNLVKAHGDDTQKGRVWVGIRFKEAALAFEEQEFGQAKPDLEGLNHGLTPALHEKYVKPTRRTVF
jgi:P4 family phage/plasmid primase-like protien